MDFGPDTFFLRVPDNAMEPAFREGDFAYVDPDVPMVPGSFVGVRLDETAISVRLYGEEHGRRVLRSFYPDRVDCEVNRGNETMICGVVVFWGCKV